MRASALMRGLRGMSPELEALSPRARQFVLMMFEMPGATATAVAKACGHGGTRGPTQAAWRFMHNPAVRAAIRAETVRRTDGTLPEAYSVLVEIMRNGKDDAVRLRAAAKVLAYRGISEVQRVEVEHRVPSVEETLAEIRRAAKALGISEEKALGSLTDVEVVELKKGPHGSFGEGGADARER